MSGRKETLLEKITKPLRLNPPGAALIGLGALAHYVNSDSVEGLNEVGKGLAALGIYSGISLLLSGIAYYSLSKTALKNKGFDKRLAKPMMGHYCERQGFNVACIEAGYRDEARKLIEKTPANEKASAWIPHF